MPGEPLMCVWQTASALDKSPQTMMRKNHLENIVQELDNIPHITFSREQFNTSFTGLEVEFHAFKHYTENNLLHQSVSVLLIIEEIEQCCWQMVEGKYSSKSFNSTQMFQLWRIFNRLCTVGTYPPRMNKHMCTVLFEAISKKFQKKRSDELYFHNGLTFIGMTEALRSFFFVRKSSNFNQKWQQILCCHDLGWSYSFGTKISSDTTYTSVNKCIEDLYCWLVQEVMKTGWMNIHIRRSGNWSSWMKYWFVLTPGYLRYYTINNNTFEKVYKGEILVDKYTKIEDMELNNNVDGVSKMKNKFKVIVQNSEAELSVDSPTKKEVWLSVFHESVNSIRCGITPQMKLLLERVKLVENDLEIIDGKLHEAQQMAEHASQNHINDGDKYIPNIEATTDIQLKSTPRESNKSEVDGTTAEDDILSLQRDKLRAMFFSIDKDGNGKICNDEFKQYIDSLGAKVDEKEANLIFESIDKDKNNYIFFEEFEDFFKNSVLGDDEANGMAILRSAFLQADKDGSGTMNFQEFSEYAYSCRRNMAMEQLMASFQKLDTEGDGEISFGEFEKFLHDSTMKEMTGSIKPPSSAENFLKNTYEKADVNELVTLLGSRWEKFSHFQRYGDKGELVMTGDLEQIQDIIPGNYSLVDLACYNDLPPIEPRKVVIKGVSWISSSFAGRSGRAFFPRDFDEKVPTEIATNEHLAYYECSLADQNQTKVSLFYRHGIQDFTYQNNYIDDYVTSESVHGGAGLEKHAFSHLDCPMDPESGIFLIGKFFEDELHLTGFKVPTRHTIYVPSGVIHSNDYLKGTWRTMLSDEAEIDHVQIVKQGENKTEENHFILSFLPL